MQHFLAVLVWLVALVACAGYGSLWLRGLFPHWLKRPADLLRVAYTVALGMGTLAYLILAVGLAGFLTSPVLAALVAGGWVAAASCLRGWLRPGVRSPETVGASPAPEGERLATLLSGGFLVLAALLTLPAVFRAPDGLDWDGLSYHLAAPKIYLREGRILFIPYDSHTNFPFTLEMLYTLGLAFGGPSAAKLFHWSAGWFTALAISGWTASLEVEGRRLPRWTGMVAAGVFISMPVVLWELGTSYIDLGTALFQFLALTALLEAFRDRPEVGRADGPSPFPWQSAVLAGVLSGFALGTKYTALLQFGLLGLGLLLWMLRTGRGTDAAAWRAVLLFGGVGLLVAAPWYVKNWLWVRNPVYPFYYSLFPESFSWTKEAEVEYAKEQRAFGLGRGPDEALKTFWNLGVHGRAFYINFRTLVGDKIGSIGIVWAGLLPLVLWSRAIPYRVGACLAYSLASVGVWFLMSQQVRYLTPVFAPLAVVVAMLLVTLTPRLLRVTAVGFTALALLLNVVMYAPLAQDSLRLVTGRATMQDPTFVGVLEAAEYINGLPENVRVALYQETRGYYFDRDYFWANPLQHNLIPYDRLTTGDDLAAALREHGITHILINYDFSRGAQYDKWYRLLMHGIGSGRFEEVFRSNGAELERRGVMVYEIR